MKHARDDYDRIQDPAGLIPADEPVFLIRGQDKAAPRALRRYALEAARQGAGDDIVNRTLAHAVAMEVWQKQHGGGKVPDMPGDGALVEGTADALRQSSEEMSSLAGRILAGGDPLQNEQVMAAIRSAIADRDEDLDTALKTVLAPYFTNMLSLAGSVLSQDETAN